MIYLALVGALLLPAPAVPPAADTPPAEQVGIELVAAAGTGCSTAAVSLIALPGNTGLRLTFAGYRAVAGGDAAPAAVRLTCLLNVAVDVPDGFSYAIARSDYRGRLHAEPGATVVARSTFYFSGGAAILMQTSTFPGPRTEDWQTTDVVEPVARPFTPCGQPRILHLYKELRANAGSAPAAPSEISVSDGALEFAWRRC